MENFFYSYRVHLDGLGWYGGLKCRHLNTKACFCYTQPSEYPKDKIHLNYKCWTLAMKRIFIKSSLDATF